MAAHAKAAPDASDLRMIDRALGKRNKRSIHVRLVGCSVGRMAAHTKAAPDDNVLRLIDRALGKLNDSAGCSPRPGLVAQAPRPQASAADGGV